MSRLVTLVSQSPSLLLGATVARIPRLRVRAAQEAWLVTQVRPAKGGGNPTVYGARVGVSAAAPGLTIDAHDAVIRGVLKTDWAVVGAPAGADAAASAVRSPVRLKLRPDLFEKALRAQAPYDTLEAALRARAAKEHAAALADVKRAADKAAEAAAAAAAAAAGGAKEEAKA